MSESESNSSQSLSVSDTDDESSYTEEEDVGIINSIIQPYQGEPLAASHDSSDEDGDDGEDDEDDEDGIPFATLEARYEKRQPVNVWCKCGHCKDEKLVGATEYRCCMEVRPASGMLVFDGSIEHISCITEHEDYGALTNATVLKQVGPLLKDRSGRGYKRRGNQTEKEFLRAVAYRWLIRWLCGYMGWENTRPLSACMYHDIRTRYTSTHSTGYVPTADRQ